MTPAASILLLTTATGFGYGLLAWIGLYAALGLLPPARAAGLVIAGVALALLLAALGLAASMLHLGRKARAWRAFSQWRSSWLSREGVAAVLTFPVAIALGLAALRDGDGGWTRLAGLAALAASLGTVYCTAMIYGSLKPIRQWHNPHTAPDYLIYAAFSGALLFALLRTVVFGTPGVVAGAAAAGSAALALSAKWLYWRHIDAQTPLATLANTIGLRADGAAKTVVKPLDAPHFTENFVLREMGYVIGRRHAARLRRIALATAFLLPLALTVMATLAVFPLAAIVLALGGAAIGLLIERWLFFAEATHVSALYYGRAI
ncbi:MAG TPA: DmsC/YnfH family molybdoenzyme membrane anchor subunit [Steroidobacteraceae bacterium]|nr:DmsC/YnfH family molybdoenzyme membrane anchor subunit [Steroidobacteraceae bacterium]